MEIGLLPSTFPSKWSFSFKRLIETTTVVDKIIIFTDTQLYSSDIEDNYYGFADFFKKYKIMSPEVKIVFWNLEGYATGVPIQLSKDVMMINGFSDKMIKYLKYIFENKNHMIEEIQNYQI